MSVNPEMFECLGAGTGWGTGEKSRRKGGEIAPKNLSKKTRLPERFLNLRSKRKRTAVEELNIIEIIEKSCSIMFEG